MLCFLLTVNAPSRYASYYESILLGQYNQLYKKGREIEHYRLLAEDSAHQTWEQGLVFLGQQVQSLVLEITALRARVAELERQLGGQVGEGGRGTLYSDDVWCSSRRTCVCVCAHVCV